MKNLKAMKILIPTIASAFLCVSSASQADCSKDYEEVLREAQMRASVGNVADVVGGLGIPLLTGAAFRKIHVARDIETAKKVIDDAYVGAGPHFDEFVKKVQEKNPELQEKMIQARLIFGNDRGLYCDETSRFKNGVALEKDLLNDLAKAFKEGWIPEESHQNGSNQNILQTVASPTDSQNE